MFDTYRKILVIAGIIFCLFSLAFAKYSGGTGEPNNPYLIATPNDVNAIGLEPGDWNKYFKMTADINWLDFGGQAAREIGDYNISQPWTGIPFSGVFDGSGHQISNWCDSSNMSFCTSLFGRVAGPNAIIKNIRFINSWTNGPVLVNRLEATVDNCWVEDGNVFGEGGLVGDNYGLIQNSYSQVIIHGDQPGALVRMNMGTIRNCSAAGKVTGDYCVGGLTAWSSGTVEDSYAVCIVDGNNAVGGLVGMNKGNVSRCFTAGTVSGQFMTGGLTGDNHPGHTISDSYSFCTVSGDDRIGGLTGYNMGTISNCYSTGSVSGSQYIGGLVGYSKYNSANISNCYSAGAVNGTSDVGGLVGYNYNGTTNASFWDVNTSGQTISAGGTGKTTAEMKTLSTFASAGWDFSYTDGDEADWFIQIDEYPILVWQISPADIYTDGRNNFRDFTIFAQYWMRDDCAIYNYYCDWADLNFDGSVDIDDLIVLMSYWLESGIYE